MEKRIIKKLNFIKAFLIGVVCAFISCLALTVGGLAIKFPAHSRILYIISSSQFWLFLILEIVFFLISKKLLRGRKAEKNELISKVQFHVTMAFAIMLAILIALLIITGMSASLIGMFVFSITLFLFQMVIVIRTELFKNILSKERKMKS